MLREFYDQVPRAPGDYSRSLAITSVCDNCGQSLKVPLNKTYKQSQEFSDKMGEKSCAKVHA